MLETYEFHYGFIGHLIFSVGKKYMKLLEERICNQDTIVDELAKKCGKEERKFEKLAFVPD